MGGTTRRSFLRHLGAAAVIPLIGIGHAARAQSAARPRLHAMIVGINRYSGKVGVKRGSDYVYRPIPGLRGCLNDARAIEASVRPLAATTQLLLDRDVTRASFFRAWQSMVAQSAPGDTLLVTYSGHGGQEPERVPGSEDDGLDETLILSQFDSSSRGLNEERIIDDEIEGLLRTVAGRNTVIFVADACHSGTMTRAVDPRLSEALSYRTVHKYDIEGELSGGVAIPAEPDQAELPHVVYLSGSQDNELVPEFRINGAWQGALSLSFARALSGLADSNGDRVITGAELSAYVMRSVRALSDSSQHPEVKWPHADVRLGIRPDEPLFFLPAQPPAPPPATASVRLGLLNTSAADRAAIAGQLTGATVLEPGEPADLTWDAGSLEVLDNLGNIVAAGVIVGNLQRVVDRVKALATARQMTLQSGLDMRLLLPGEARGSAPSRASDRTHVRGTRLTLVASGLRHRHFVLLNIAGDGTVQFLYPNDADPKQIDPARSFELPLEVTPPFGADFAIGVNAARPLPELVEALKRLNGQKQSAEALAALSRSAAGGDLLVGMQGIFTRGK